MKWGQVLSIKWLREDYAVVAWVNKFGRIGTWDFRVKRYGTKWKILGHNVIGELGEW